MTALRYRRPSERRTLQATEERVAPVEFGNPRPTFRAAITNNWSVITTERRPYFDDASTDTVFWDYWDDNYNRQFFEPTFQTVLTHPSVAAVQLLIPGIYAIRATIDWENAALNLSGAFNTWIGSNFDDGGVTHIYADLNSSIILSWTLNQTRIVWPAYTGAEGSVEITAAHDLAGATLYIPGGINGYWSYPPMLNIAYLGGIEGDPLFFADT